MDGFTASPKWPCPHRAHRPFLMKFGIDRLLDERRLRKPLAGRRVALLAHPASVTRDLRHSLDALAALRRYQPHRGLRPAARPARRQAGQHGRVAGFQRSALGIPVFSLYGEVRKPTPAMLETFDVLLVDLQDLGCRIYTFITTLRYVLEAARKGRQGRLGARSPQPGRSPGRRPHAARGLGKLRRRRSDADAARPDARRARRTGSCAR